MGSFSRTPRCWRASLAFATTTAILFPGGMSVKLGMTGFEEPTSRGVTGVYVSTGENQTLAGAAGFDGAQYRSCARGAGELGFRTTMLSESAPVAGAASSGTPGVTRRTWNGVHESRSVSSVSVAQARIASCYAEVETENTQPAVDYLTDLTIFRWTSYKLVELTAAFIPRSSGPHIFKLGTEEVAQLFFGGGEQGAAVIVTSWSTGYTSAPPQELVAGRRYYMKVVWNDYDHYRDEVRVAVVEPGGTTLSPIPAQNGGHTFLEREVPTCATQPAVMRAGVTLAPARQAKECSEPGIWPGVTSSAQVCGECKVFIESWAGLAALANSAYTCDSYCALGGIGTTCVSA